MVFRVLPFFAILFTAVQAFSQISVAKLSLSSAAIGAVSLAFENVHNKQFAWQLGVSYRPKMSGPEIFLRRGESEFKLVDSKSNGVAFHGEYRFYTQKARIHPVKPYFAIYLQHGIIDLETHYQKELVRLKFNANWNYTTLGIQYGIQWILKERYTIDLTLVGFGINRNKVTGNATMDPHESVGLFEEHLAGIPQIGKRFGLFGKEGFYSFDEKFIGVSIRFALRVGWLF